MIKTRSLRVKIKKYAGESKRVHLSKKNPASVKIKSQEPAKLIRIKKNQSKRVSIMAEQFDESEHPRANDGKFTDKTGGGGESKIKETNWIKGEIGKDRKLKLESGQEIPEHIKKLGAIPAWKNMTINPDPEGEPKVKGRDKKGRPQALYSEEHGLKQDAIKFGKVDKGLKEYEAMGREIKLALQGEPPESDVAKVMNMVYKMGLRPGSTKDTGAKKQAYGATTLRAEHVKVDTNGKVRLQFTGKKGVSIDLEVEDEALADSLKKRKEEVGEGRLYNVNEVELRDFAKTLDGGGFKTKDFRTMVGTKTAREMVSKMEKPKNMKEYKEAVKKVAIATSKRLGNDPSMALKAYINPNVFEGWKI